MVHHFAPHTAHATLVTAYMGGTNHDSPQPKASSLTSFAVCPSSPPSSDFVTGPMPPSRTFRLAPTRYGARYR